MLKSLGCTLQDWKEHTFGNVKKRICQLKQDLENIQNLPRNSETMSKEEELVHEIYEWLLREEILWKQRARTDWIREGDNNTKYFHRHASARRSKNTVVALEDEKGSLCKDEASL